MRHIISVITALLSAISATAQWRLDADIRFGQTNIDFRESWWEHSGSHGYWFYDKPSWGADVNIGRELSHGLAVYSGLMYDMMRFFGADETVPDPIYHMPKNNSGMYVFSFVTVPVRVEYRCVRDMIRPYCGLGASFKCATHKSFVERELRHSNNYKTVVPTFLYGVNLEYKRFIVGFARRKDMTHFWLNEYTGKRWQMAQTTVKIGYRIF